MPIQLKVEWAFLVKLKIYRRSVITVKTHQQGENQKVAWIMMVILWIMTNNNMLVNQPVVDLTPFKTEACFSLKTLSK